MCRARREKSDLCNKIYVCIWVLLLLLLLLLLSSPLTNCGVNVGNAVGEIEAGVWNKLYICSFNIASLESIFWEIGLDKVVLLQQGIGFNNVCGEEEEDGTTSRDE